MTGRKVVAVTAIAGLAALVAATIALAAPAGELIALAIIGAWTLVVGTIGTVIALARRDNPLGWLLLSIAVVIQSGLFAEAYASYGLEVGTHQLPLAALAAWLSLWLTVPGFALFLYVFLLFPTGTLLTRRWRALAVAIAAAATTQTTYLMVKPGPIDNVPVLHNPLGIPAADTWLLPLTNVAQTVLVFCGLAAIASLVVRFRRSDGIERQQMKVVALGALVFPACFAVVMALDASMESAEGAADYLGFAINMIGLLAIPVSIGAAILRYRLYDIDLVINRTLVYGTVTAISAAAYSGLVVAFQSALSPLTRESDLAIAASTLAVAGLFGPVRRRVQALIDRRFYRSRYDAQRTLEGFSTRLRDEIDLDHLSSDLLGVVAATVRPRHASLWLREAPR